MNKYKVYWWIRGTGGHYKKQGFDIIETEIALFDEVDAEEKIAEDLQACIAELGGGTGAEGVFSWYHDPKADNSDFKPNLPNFLKAHREIMEVSPVSNWGVRKVKEIEEK